MADNLTPEQRSYCMSRVKGRDTGLEKAVRSAIHKRGLRFRKHSRNLPGRPDVVFIGAKLAVFIDGDFWHGYRFPAWVDSLPPFWREKIRKNRERDQRNFARLRKMGWRVLRVWQHQLKSDLTGCILRIISMVKGRGTEKLR
ncbi:MAG: very short patch repair endonuclease [Desulfobacteria bacterium]